MEKKIYVVGHKNPDTDSIASAIAYAELKKRLGHENVFAAMAGTPNPQTRYVLERIGMEPPQYIADVHPKVRDVLSRRPITAHASMPLKETLELFHIHGIRVLPVVDEENIPLGVVSLLKLSEKYLVAGTSSRRRRSTNRPGHGSSAACITCVATLRSPKPTANLGSC